MMLEMSGRTQVEHTKPKGRYSAITIQNKDPRFDYSMARRADIENGSDMYGWEPLNSANNNGEKFGNYPGAKTKGNGQLNYLDTTACKRPKEVSEFFKREEDEKYNTQLRLVRSSSKNIKAAFRKLDPNSTVINKGSLSGPGMTQRQGPTEEDNHGE